MDVLTHHEIVDLRKTLYNDVKKLPHLGNGWEPEAKDFDVIRSEFLSKVAYKIWEKTGKPKNRDMDIWLEAERIWNFIRYMW